jgi:hypothetical protein
VVGQTTLQHLQQPSDSSPSSGNGQGGGAEKHSSAGQTIIPDDDVCAWPLIIVAARKMAVGKIDFMFEVSSGIRSVQVNLGGNFDWAYRGSNVASKHKGIVSYELGPISVLED